MFQNIARDFEENQNSYEDVELNKKEKIKEAIKKCVSKKIIMVYIVSFLLSCVSFNINKELAPFGIAILVAILSNCIPIGIASIFVITGTSICFGGSSTLNLLLTLFLVFVSILIKSPKYEEEKGEKRKLGLRLFISCLLVQVVPLFFKQIVIYDLLFAVIYSIAAFIFYKIFSNSIDIITNIGEKRAYSIEEVMGASLMLAICVCAIGDVNVFGFSVRNILCILVVLVMGWKNGILVGATSGVTIGSVVGIIGGGEPIIIATYALSGMIAGIFNRLGKIGVIIGFILGNVLLTYVSNGNTSSIIAFQEILIASLGLLAVPKNVKIDIEDLYGKVKLLPDGADRTLEENKDTIYKLNSMSETIYEMSKTYKEAAATIVDEEELKKQEEDNLSIFERELENNLEGLEENILFDDIYSPEDNLIEDIFNLLLDNERINRRDLLDVLAAHNNYIIGYEKDYISDDVEKDIEQMVKIINYSYKVSKLNFIWKKKLDENKKAVSSQLEEVSKAIGNLADQIDAKENDPFAKQKEEIKLLLKEKDIEIQNINYKKEPSGRIEVTLYTPSCENVENPTCDIKKMARIISKVCEENMILQKQECALRKKVPNCMYTFISEDKQQLRIGIAKTTKADSTMSGDTSIQTKLEDGKYLLAISDGMGSGKEARKASKTAIAMLDRLLTSGFDKNSSLRMINSTLNAIGQEDMYATLDIAILDLYAGNLEFIKNGACPTYVKNRRNVEVLKSVSLPTGILNDIDLVVYDKDLQDGDILVMCSDGILESSEEYTNKELWLKFLLEEIETEDVQKIADIILQEAIDNNYGKPKDDMTVIVARVNNK